MRGRTNVGGGAGLNFKVVGGTAQPTNPKENTIWVNTDTKITSWNFSATEPHRRSGNKNLNVYPYDETSSTTNGVAFTDNENDTITANGTGSNATAYFACSGAGFENKEFLLEPGTYTLSGGVDKCHLSIRCTVDDWTTNLVSCNASENPTTFTIDQTVKARIFLAVPVGVTLTNAVFRPQLEKGSTATSFVKGDATGQVWIETGTASTVAFNALKKNSVMIYPLSAKQYVSGAWVRKPAKSYQGGEWVGWHRWVYHYGDDCEAITGGWLTYNYAKGTSSNYNYTIGTCTNSESGFVLTTAELKSIARQTVNPIDLTNVNTIEVYLIMSGVKNYSNTDVFVASADKTLSNGTFGARWRASALLSSLTKVELDVSALTGLFYIGVGQSKWDSDPITTTVASIELV